MSAEPVVFTIPGKPFGKQRARSGRGGRFYTPKETVAFEAYVRGIAAPHFPQPITGPVRLTVWATFAPPPSWSRRKAAAHLGRRHTQKPDMSNIVKIIEDALNGLAYVDDCQICDGGARKVWGPVARTVVTVEDISPEPTMPDDRVFAPEDAGADVEGGRNER